MKIEFIKNLFKSFFTVNIGNLLNYVTSIIIIRSLSIDEYSLYISFFSLLFFFSLPNLILNQIILKIQNVIKNNYQVFKIINLYILIICFIKLVILYNLSDFLKKSFNLNNIQYFEIYLILCLVLSLYYNFFSTLFLKTRLYMTYNITTQSMFLLKFLFVLWLYNNKNAYFENLLQVHILSQILALLIILYFLKFFSVLKYIINDKIKKFENFKHSLLLKYLLSIFISQFLLYAIFNYDILICRSSCSEYNSGLYGAASTMSKIIYFLAASISTILLREIFHINEEKKNYIKLVFIISIPLLIFYNISYYFFSETIINIFFDEKYNTKLFIQISTTLNLAMSVMILTSYLIIVFLTRAKAFYFIKQFFITICAFIVTYLYNDQNPQYIATFFLISSTCLLSSLIYDFRKKI